MEDLQGSLDVAPCDMRQVCANELLEYYSDDDTMSLNAWKFQ